GRLTRWDFWKKLHARFRADQWGDALEQLAGDDIVRMAPIPSGRKGGRPGVLVTLIKQNDDDMNQLISSSSLSSSSSSSSSSSQRTDRQYLRCQYCNELVRQSEADTHWCPASEWEHNA